VWFVFRWAEAKCDKLKLPSTPENQRKVLGRALFLIRFPLMSLEEFSKVVVDSGLLTERETLQFFKLLAGSPNASIVGSFNSEHRKSQQQCIKIYATTACREKVVVEDVERFDFELWLVPLEYRVKKRKKQQQKNCSVSALFRSLGTLII